MSLPHEAVGWSAVRDCGTSWLYSPIKSLQLTSNKSVKRSIIDHYLNANLFVSDLFFKSIGMGLPREAVGPLWSNCFSWRSIGPSVNFVNDQKKILEKYSESAHNPVGYK